MLKNKKTNKRSLSSLQDYIKTLSTLRESKGRSNNSPIMIEISPTKISSLNTRREEVRNKRVLLLKGCVSPTFRRYQHVKQLSPGSWGSSGLIKGQSIRSVSKKRHGNITKSVWKGFTNTLMRNGERLRSQTMLRKCLFLL